jgi:alpha/beta superfamily hydrolase
MIAEQTARLATVDHLVLDARLALPASPVAGLVVCHPHPLYGGEMDNPVVIRVAEACQERNFATLRFNFRGVGSSTGSHGGGKDEVLDVQAALAHLRAALGPSVPLGLAGYSFGSTVAAQVAARGAGEPVAGLALVAPPVARTGPEAFLGLASLSVPLLIVAGSRDEYCPKPALDALRSGLPGATLQVIEGADHFFFGKLFPLGEAVATWSRRLEPGQTAGRGGPS